MGQLQEIFEESFPDEFKRVSYDLWVQNFRSTPDRDTDRGRLPPRELDMNNSGVVQGRIRHSNLPTFRTSDAGQVTGYDAQVKVPADIEYPLHAADDERVDHATEIVDPSDGKRYRVLDYHTDHNTIVSLQVRELAGSRPSTQP